MNLDEVISIQGIDEITDELKDVIDPETIPDPSKDPEAYEFFDYIVSQFNKDSDKKFEVKKEAGYAELGKIELYGLTSLPGVLGLHESLHALAAYISGAHFCGFSNDSWGLYTNISGTPSQVAFTSLFPHLLAIPAFYYGVQKKNILALPFLVPTLTEVIPAFMVGKESDFMIAAENICPTHPILTKYALLGGWYLMSYAVSKLVYRRNLKHEK